MAQPQRGRRLMGDINVVPYIDVMLVLLIIFMVTAPLLTQGVKVDLPKAGAEPIASTQNLTPLVLSIDRAVADRWGRLVAAAGRPLPAIDSLLAATALTHDLVLVTRNSKDFAGLPVVTLNPWST